MLTDPVRLTREEWVKQQGGDYFNQFVVPATAIRLTQAAGRLLRTETDSGQIVVFDRRLAQSGYGRAMLKALPPFARNDRPSWLAQVARA